MEQQSQVRSGVCHGQRFEKAEKLPNDKDYVLNVLQTGAKKCRDIAAQTMAEVRARLGLR